MLKYWLWLAELPGLTNQARLALLRHFGTPENAFYADAGEILLTEGMTKKQAAALEEKSLSAAERILADCRRLGLRVLTVQDAEYYICCQLHKGPIRSLTRQSLISLHCGAISSISLICAL